MSEIEEQTDFVDHVSTSKEQPTKRRKRGILGVPVGDSPMLFSFTSRELWPDEKSEGEDDSDEDYLPEEHPPKSSSPKYGKRPKTQVQSPDDSGSCSSSNTEINGSLANDSQVSTQDGSVQSDSPLNDSSAKIPPQEVADNFDTTKVKGARKPRVTKPKKEKAPKPKKKPRKRDEYTTPRKSKASKSKNASSKSKSSYKTKSKSSSSSSINGHPSSSKSPTAFNDFNLLVKPVKFDFEQILPPELLTKIFTAILEDEQQHAQTLIKLSQVCENWRNLIISSPILWTRLDLNGFIEDRFPMLNFQRLNEDNTLFRCVRELDLSGWNGTNAEKIIDIVAESANFDLELLNVKNCRNISSRFLDTIVHRCPNLKSLDISAITYFFGHNIAFFDSMQSWSRHGRGKQIALRKLPPTKKTSSHQNCQNPFTTSVFRPLLETIGGNIRSFYMSENMMPSFPTCISIIMEFCPNLEVLDVSNVASLGSRSTAISVDKLQRACPNLRVLRAANVNFTPTVCSAASSPVLGFPHLEELSIPFHESFMMPASILDGNTDWTLELLTKGAENLTLLDIRGSRFISPRGLLKIPTWSLKHLSISNCAKLEDDTLEAAFSKWNKSLVDVDFSWNKSERCMDACIDALCELEPGESQLKSIQLRGSAISYEKLCKLLRKCPLITSTDLQSCRGLPRGIKRTFNDQEFAQLRADLLDGKYD